MGNDGMGSQMEAPTRTIERPTGFGPGGRRYSYRENVWIRPINLHRATQIKEGQEVELIVFSRKQWTVKGIVASNTTAMNGGGLYVQRGKFYYYLPQRYFGQLRVWEMWEWK